MIDILLPDLGSFHLAPILPAAHALGPHAPLAHLPLPPLPFIYREMFASLTSAASAQLPSFPLRTLSGLMWTLARSRHYDRTFYGEAAGALTALLQQGGEGGGGGGGARGSFQPRRRGGPTAVGVQQRDTAQDEPSEGAGEGSSAGAHSALDLACTSMAFAQFNHYNG